MLDFEIIKVRCPYSQRKSCWHPRSLSGNCIAIDCKLTSKQYDEIILGNKTQFVPYMEMRQH